MKNFFAKYIQDCIYYAAEVDESSSPIDMLTGEEGLRSWCCAVNLIYRCLASNLWTAEHASCYMPSWFKENGLTGNYDFCKRLSEYSPFVYDDINMRYWIEPVLCNTEYGQYFVESFGLENLEGDVFYPFIEALEHIFYKHGISWEDGDLFGMNTSLD